MQIKTMHLYILLQIESLNIKIMQLNYIRLILKKFPNIASGRKKFRYFDKRVKKNIKMTKKYFKNKKVD